MEGPGNSIISEVTGDDAFPFLGSVARSKRCHRVAQGGFHLNDVKGLWKSSEIEKGNCSILTTLRGMPGLFYFSFLKVLQSALEIHLLSDFYC